MLLLPLFAHSQTNPADSADLKEAQVVAAQEHPVLYWHGITLNGFLSAAYSYNTNHPAPQLNQFRTYDFEDNEFKIDVAEAVIQRTVSKPNDGGFRIDFTAGDSIPEVTASYGMFRNKLTGEGRHIDIHQLFASYILPVGKGLRFDAGKFVTSFGYEVVEGYEGYNDNYSHSFLFGYGIPFTHTGIRSSYAPSSKVAVTAMVVNGWDDVHDNNRAKSAGAQLAITPTKSVATYVNYMAGAESPANNHSMRQAINLVQTWSAKPRLSFSADFLFGHEDDSLGPGSSATWTAFAGYSRYSFTDQFSLAFRGETFRDPEGVRTGKVQTLIGFTLTPEYRRTLALGRLPTKVILRGDIRYDHSNVPVFVTQNQAKQRQCTLAVNLIYTF
jgi:hypothetical protein